MDDDKVKIMMQLDPAMLRTELETMTTEELREMARHLARRLQSQN